MLVYFTTWQTLTPVPFLRKPHGKMKLEIRILPWCSLGGRERLETSLASHPSHAFCVTALLRGQYAPAREGQCSERALWSAATWEIGGHLLTFLPSNDTACVRPCSNRSSTPPRAMLGRIGWFSLYWKGNGSKWAEKLLQLLHDDTKKAEEVKKGFQKQGQRGSGKCQVRWGIFELTPSLHTNIITCLSNATTQMVKMGVSSVV